MLTHPTLDKLQTLKCTAMATALAEQMRMPDIEELAFEERLGLLVDREITERENRRLTSRCAAPDSSIMPPWRMSTIAIRGDWTKP